MASGLGLLEFLAEQLYQGDCRAKNTIGVRWMCLRDDVAVKYLKRAQTAFDAWVLDEKRAEGLRKANDPRAFFDRPKAPQADGRAEPWECKFCKNVFMQPETYYCINCARCPHGVRSPHECREGCQSSGG